MLPCVDQPIVCRWCSWASGLWHHLLPDPPVSTSAHRNLYCLSPLVGVGNARTARSRKGEPNFVNLGSSLGQLVLVSEVVVGDLVPLMIGALEAVVGHHHPALLCLFSLLEPCPCLSPLYSGRCTSLASCPGHGTSG